MASPDPVSARRPRWIAAYASAAVLVVALVGCWMALAGPTGITLTVGSDARRSVVFPYSDPHAPTSTPMDFTFHVHRRRLTAESFVFVPDDHLVSIAVNGRDLSLAGLPAAKLDDYSKGFSLPVGRDLVEGDNVVVVRVLNRGAGPGGLDVHAEPKALAVTLTAALAALATIALLAAGMRIAGCGWPMTAIGGVGLALRLGYLWVTPMMVRAHDAAEHMEYVRYLLDHHCALPKAADGWAFYHPPVYYFIAAAIDRGLALAGIGPHYVEAALQLLSVAFDLGFCAFLAAAARLWLRRVPDAELGRRTLGREGLTVLCAALIVLWPANAMHSVRVGNDDLAYLWFGGAIYFGSRWWLGGPDARPRDFHVATAIAAIGVVTKSHCLILFVVLGLALVVRFFRDPGLRSSRVLAYLAPLVLLFAVSTALDLHEALGAFFSGKQDYIFVGNAHRTNPALTLTNRPLYFLGFDFPTYLRTPFTSPWEDAKGREWFWNYLFKTSLFGEWEIKRPVVEHLATALSWAGLLMCPIAIWGAVRRRGTELLDDLPLVAMVLMLVGGLAGQRLQTPVFHGDFRYALPSIGPLSYWYVRAAGAQAARGTVWGACVAGLGWAFVVTAAAFVAAIFWTA